MGVIRNILKFALRKAGFSVARLNGSPSEPTQSNPAVKGYIDAEETIKKASALKLSAAEYCYNILGWGSPNNWVEELEKLGIFDRFKNKRILEIGSGAGLLLSEAKKRLDPCVYESYEPSDAWSK